MNNEPREYTIVTVNETSFDPDNYGNKFYSVKMAEYPDGLLWKTKNRPETDTKVYGHIEMSKSGKSKLFKRDQREQFQSGSAYRKPTTSPQVGNDDDIRQILHIIQKQVDAIHTYIFDLEKPESVKKEVVLDDIGDKPIDLSDIPDF